MISIRTFNDYFNNYLSLISEIDHFVLVAQEDHLVKKLSKNKSGVILAAVMPASDANSPDLDNIADTNTALLFILEKTDKTSVTDATELTHYEKLQNIAKDVYAQLRADALNYRLDRCHFMHYFNQDSVHVDPEYNLFGGYNGYSMSFEFVTDNF